jgi:hypothetical protein
VRELSRTLFLSPSTKGKRMPRIREHNEYFRTVSLSGRKSCPSCSEKLEPGESIWSWGNYVRIRWVTVTHFCKKCFPERVRARLNGHTNGCGCTVNLKGYCGERLPEWLTLETECTAT